MLNIYVIDAETRNIQSVQISEQEFRKHVHPIFLIPKVTLRQPYIMIAAHPAALFKLPGSDAIHILSVVNNRIRYFRVNSTLGQILIANNIAALIIEKPKADVEICIENGKIVFKTCNRYSLRICKDVIESDIELVKGIETLQDATILLHASKNIPEHEATSNEITLMLKRMKALQELCPILSGPIRKEGIISLIKRLIDLEFVREVEKLLKIYKDSRVGSAYCPVKCLNEAAEYSKHFSLNSLELIDYVIDKEIFKDIKYPDTYFIVLTLYMLRMSYPEYISDRIDFVKKIAKLYSGVVLCGLCPFYTIHFAKDRLLDFELCSKFVKFLACSDVCIERMLDELCISSICELDIENIRKLYDKYIVNAGPYEYVEDVPKIQKIKVPVVQAAIDLVAPIEIIEDIVEKCVRGGIKIIEIGTPLLKRFGSDIVSKVVYLLEKLGKRDEIVLFADTKTMDVGDLEARIMYRAGADMVAVLAAGVIDKILEALYEAVKHNRAVLIDLIQVEDPVAFVEKNIELLRRYRTWLVLCIHRGITEQLRGRGVTSDVELIKKIKNLVPDVLLAVAGGLKPGTLRQIRDAGADILIVGAALYTSRDVYGTARKLVEEVS